jgi:hypothetical protein
VQTHFRILLRTMSRFSAIVAVCIACFGIASQNCIAAESLSVRPAKVLLDNPEASQQLIVTHIAGQQSEDLTHRVQYKSENTGIAVVTKTGRVLPRREGQTFLSITHNHESIRIPVLVRGLNSPQPVSFRNEIIPILSKAGCNSGGCHGKAEGQNGFKLSVFGYDPLADHNALTKEGRGRRISIATPRQSLLLTKSLATTPHGGGRKIKRNSPWHHRMARWIKEGAILDAESGPQITAIEVEPKQVVMKPNGTQQIRVTAIDSTGHRRCVTIEAEFKSNAEPIVGADSNGLLTASDSVGEAAILVRYMGHVAVCRVTLPQPGVTFARPNETNFIDKLVWNKLKRLGIAPSELASDSMFLRRVYLDTIGTLPTSKETRDFLNDKSPQKRSRLIDRLLKRDEYADYRAMRWADLLRADRLRVTPQGTVAMTRWLRRQFKQNTPYDEFVRAIVSAKGNTLAEGPASFYQVHKDPQLAGRAVSQLFLGVRIECAQCHHHPFERWSQKDYYAFAGFFTGVSRKKISTGGQKIFPTAGSDLKHPRTKLAVPTAGLATKPAILDGVSDRRDVLAKWMTSPENPFFARMIANRLWAHYFGRGLVEPIDDMRTTNPATNEPLLDALAKHLVQQKFDLKAFTRTMLNSRVYQLSSRPNKTNLQDDRNFSRSTWKPMPAEVLLDAICQSTGIPESFNGWPAGYRAIQVWDNRMPSYFFRIFGKPQRLSVCECERGNEPSIVQALHLMNSPESVHKIRHRDGRAAKLAKSNMKSDKIIEQLYLTMLSRYPSTKETALMQLAFDESESRRSAIEDILWTLMNTREFVYNH